MLAPPPHGAQEGGRECQACSPGAQLCSEVPENAELADFDSHHDYLGPFSVEEEEEDLSKDLLRLEVNFGEVLEEKEEDAALVDFLSQLHL